MDLLLAALGTFFVVTLVLHFVSLRGYQEMALELVLASAAATIQGHIASREAVYIFGIAGLAHTVRAVFRLVQAWADRVEASNMREVLPGRRPRV